MADDFPFDVNVHWVTTNAGTVTWESWSKLPRQALIGWRGVFADGETVYCYLMPGDGVKPRVRVYVGHHGDPLLDHCHSVITLTPRSWT